MSKTSAYLPVAILLPSLNLSAQVQDLTARASIDGKRAMIRWTSPTPTRCRVEYGPTSAYGQAIGEDPQSLRGTTNNRDSGVDYANNHRVDVPMPTGGTLHYRFHCEDREGKTTVTRDATVQPAPPPRGKTGVQSLKISIDRSDSTLREPHVVLGVPFPPAHLAGTENLRLTYQGTPLPSQTTVVSRYWSDGSIKWARVAFQAPEAAEAVTLEYGTGARCEAHRPIGVVVDALAFRIESDVLRVACNSQGEGKIQRKSGGAVALPQSVLIGKDGRRYVARPEEVVVEEVGPVRAVVRVRGRHVADDGSKLFGYVQRVYVLAGKPYVRLDHTFENDVTEVEMTAIRLLALEVLGTNSAAVAATGNGKRVLKPGHRVFQREDFEWVDGTGKRQGKRLPGTVDVGEARIMVKSFWQQYPKAFEGSDDGLQIGLLPPLPQDFYAGRGDECKLYYYIRDGLYTFRQGFSKTHELWIDLSRDSANAALVEDRPVASAPAQWIEDSGALRGLGVAARTNFPGYDEGLEAMAKGIPVRRERAREYGMMNFGDWYGERGCNWGNLEYDLGHGLLTQFARTGSAPLFWRAQEALRHEGDVDTRHYASDPRRVGQQWTHCMGHTAHYYPRDYRNMKIYASPGWSDNRGHIWAQGLLEHYLLGGDRRSWDTGLLIADWAAGPQTTNFRFGNAREPGWMLKLVMSAYCATNDPYYLNGARLMVREVRKKSEATGNRGLYYHRLSGGHCNCEKKHYGEAGFMAGVLMTGLKMYYDATGEERAADDIVRIARFICDTMWVEDRCAFRYTSCPLTNASSGSVWIMLEGLAFAATHGGDKQLQDICRRALAASWRGFSSGGKGSGYMICSAAQGIHEFAKIPGPSLKEVVEATLRELRNPARRCLPTLLNNPDFEETIHGWPPRGGTIGLDTDVKHSGRQSLRFEGELLRQNEYVNTCYDTSGDPGEIVHLVPNETYRLTCWLRVDKLSPGTPAPSVRLAFRDAAGTRGAKTTNAYDLSKMGTWQKLSVDAKIPEWNTRNYIALNTRTPERLEALLYLDDVSLVRVERATRDTYTYIRLDPATAERSPGVSLVQGKSRLQPSFLEGSGTASFGLSVPDEGEYFVWARANGDRSIATLSIGSKAVGSVQTKEKGWAWVRVGSTMLSHGEHSLLADLPVTEGQLGRIVVTNDPEAQR